jgi:hypothetical protein
MSLVRRGPVLVAIVTTVAALVMVPGPAGAERHHEHDGVADMWSTAVGALSYRPAPRHVEGDIIATRVVHAARAVWIRIRLRELTTENNGIFDRVAIKSDRRYRFVDIEALPGHWEGTARMTGSAGRPVACALHLHLDYDLNEARLKVPRQCLGKPSWVRVGARSSVAARLRVYADDGHSTGVPSRIALGPRVMH